MSRAIDDGQPVHAELPLSTQAGGRIWTQMSLTPVMSETEPAVVENHVSANIFLACKSVNVLVIPLPDAMMGDLGPAWLHFGFDNMKGSCESGAAPVHLGQLLNSHSSV